MERSSIHDQEHSTGDLVQMMSEQVSVLIRDEMKLARLEMAGKGKQAALGAGMFGASGVVAVYGVGCLLACAIIAVSGVVAAWLAALIVGAALLAAAGCAALLGRRRLQKAAPPVAEQALAGAKAAERKVKATEMSGQVRRSQVVQRRWPVAAAAASVVLVGSLLVWRRRKT